MDLNINSICKLSELISLNLGRKPKIVLNPEEQYRIKVFPGIENTENINQVADTAGWKISEDMQEFIKELSDNDEISNEEKILLFYDKMCQKYVYDDNLISYMRKVDDDKYFVPDKYGKDIDEEWEENRKVHNRRVCYELARELAKGLNELFKNNPNYNICIVWDEDYTHYFVGLTYKNEYFVTLDLDDFTHIKDLTRSKMGLTLDGIKILEDKNDDFSNALHKFNKGRASYATLKLANESEEQSKNEEISEDSSEDVIFLKSVLKILNEKYNLDSQGMFETLKEIVDIKIGSMSREKVFKVLKSEDSTDTRKIRCLVVSLGVGKKYLIDVDSKIMRQFDESEFEKGEFQPCKDNVRNWDDEPYSGR